MNRYNPFMTVAVLLILVFAAMGILMMMTAAVVPDQAEKKKGNMNPDEYVEKIGTQKKGFDFKLPDLNGNDITMVSFSDCDEVLVYFWNPGNETSDSEMDELGKFYQEHWDDGVGVLVVYPDEWSKDEAQRVHDQYNLFFPFVMNVNLFKRLSSDQYPHAALIDREGTVVYSYYDGYHTAEQWESDLQKYISQ